MKNISGSLTITDADELNEVKSAIDALQMLADAALLSDESYDEHRAAEAIHFVAEAAREKLDTITENVKTALKAV